MPALSALGIDFGTSNSSMARAGAGAGGAEVVRDVEGYDKTPSVVYFGKDETVVGGEALNVLVDARGDPDVRASVIRSVKRSLLTPPRIALPDGRTVRPVEVAAEILSKLRRDAAEADSGTEPTRAVITCPAIFDGMQGHAIVEAAQLAGFQEVELLEEPAAAALAFEHAGGRVGTGVLVYDFGGGTFDAAFAVREEGEDRFYLALEPHGDAHCGGDDIDQVLYDYFDDQARRELARPIALEDGTLDVNFLWQCRRRKENLSKSRHATFSTMLEGGVAFRSAIERGEFEELIGDRVERTVRITLEMAEQARDAGYPVDTVLLVGGSSQLPLVQRRIAEALGLEPQRWGNRDVAVALGAAHHANTLWGAPGAPPDPAETYRRSVAFVWSDGRREQHEKERLEALRRELGLSAREARTIEAGVREGATVAEPQAPKKKGGKPPARRTGQRQTPAAKPGRKPAAKPGRKPAAKPARKAAAKPARIATAKAARKPARRRRAAPAPAPPPAPELVALSAAPITRTQVKKGQGGLAIGHGAVWLAGGNLWAGALVRIHPGSGRVLDEIPLKKDANGVAVTDEAVWALAGKDGTLSRVDPTTREIVAQANLGKYGVDLAAAGGSLWLVCGIKRRSFVRVDEATLTVIGEVEYQGMGTAAIDAGPAGVWAAFGGNSPKTVWCEADEGVLRIATEGGSPIGIAVGDDAVWFLSDEKNRRLYRIDTASKALVAAVDVGEVSWRSGAVAVGYGSVWVATRELLRIDPARNEVVDRFPLGEDAQQIAVGAGAVWIASGMLKNGLLTRFGVGGA